MSNRNIPQAVRNAVWLKYMGEVHNGKCYCCKLETISKGVFECGHVISDKNGGKITLDNLRPICSLCNKSMGKRDMNEFIKEYGMGYDEKLEYLRTFNEQQLSLMCKWLCLPYHDTIESMIENLRQIDLKQYINTDMSYIVKCKSKKCVRCKYSVDNNILKCECGSHYYYTNKQFDEDYVCEVCGNVNVSFTKNIFKIQTDKPKTQEKQMDEYDFTKSEILTCEINNKPIEKLTYANVFKQVLLQIGDKQQIFKTYSDKYMNIIDDKKTDNGYKYFNEMKLSIQGANANHTLKEIQHMCDTNKIKNLRMEIKLVCGDVVKITK